MAMLNNLDSSQSARLVSTQGADVPTTAAANRAPANAPAFAPSSGIYRPRRPAATLLHRVMRDNLETYLASGLCG